jgi:CubicO group peptidase (beta-lactamase class C family)
LSLPSAALSSTFTPARRVFNSRARALFALSTVAVPLASSVVPAALVLPPSLDADGFGLAAPDVAGDGDAPSGEGGQDAALTARSTVSSGAPQVGFEPGAYRLLHDEDSIRVAWLTRGRSARRVIRGPGRFGSHSADYGYLWWILSLADPMNPRPRSGDVSAAAGARGQWIFAVPSLGLVVVTSAENDDANWARPVDFLFTHIIGALTR